MIKILNKHKDKPLSGVTVYCGRPSIYGNPHSVNSRLKGEERFVERNRVCDEYEITFKKLLEDSEEFKTAMNSLLYIAKIGDLNLVCFCHPKRCHTETIKNWLETQMKCDEKKVENLIASSKLEGIGLNTCPSTEEDTDRYVNYFSQYMKNKMNKNLHKGLPIISVETCINRLHEELKELTDSIDANLDPEEINKEAADVANFAMFIAMNYKRLYNSNVDKK